MNETYLILFDLARPFLDTRENEQHTRIAYEFAERLLREEGGDPEVVLPAIILHDVGWKCVPEDLQITAFGPGEKDMDLNRVHEVEGARIAEDLLNRAGYPPDLIIEIREIVLGHDSRVEPLSLNDAIVKDSDKLWRYSEHGFRTNVKRFGLPVPRYLIRLRTKLDEWFLTKTARRLAREEERQRTLSYGRPGWEEAEASGE